jgi:hypothetical protein
MTAAVATADLVAAVVGSSGSVGGSEGDGVGDSGGGKCPNPLVED